MCRVDIDDTRLFLLRRTSMDDDMLPSEVEGLKEYNYIKEDKSLLLVTSILFYIKELVTIAKMVLFISKKKKEETTLILHNYFFFFFKSKTNQPF